MRCEPLSAELLLTADASALPAADVLLTAGAQCVLNVGMASVDAVDNASFLTELCRTVD